MKFYDKVQIICISGQGGNGATSARREAGVPYGGPNGGNGGHGGSVIFKADRNYNTLLHLRFQKEREAQDGFPGESTDKYGKSAQDRIILLPVGSIIKVLSYDLGQSENKEGSTSIVYHFTQDGEEYVVCKGGIGGAGNMHFKNSLVQFPDFSLFGEPGQRKSIEIELQLLADVGLIGMPSVGKSSLINSISQTKAKVAEYHFTTLIPNLGSVSYHDTTRNIIDIPGLVAGASEGKGLGNDFLRHVLKARLFAFVLDIARWDEGVYEFGTLRKEIISYMQTRFVGSKEFGFLIEKIYVELHFINNQLVLSLFDQHKRLILQKAIVWIVNKIDEAMDKEIQQEYQSQLIKHIIDQCSPLFSDSGLSLNQELLSQQIFFYSTILDTLKKPLLQFMFDKLQGIAQYEVHFDTVAAKALSQSKWVKPYGSIDQQSVQDLFIELGYHPQDFESELYELGKVNLDGKEKREYTNDEVDSEEDSDNNEVVELEDSNVNAAITDTSDPLVARLFQLYEPELARLSYQLPWGKVLAEEWFWRVMKQQGLHKRLHRSGVRTGDILWVVGDYNSNKHILFPYILGDNKTSYKHQKLT